MAVQGERGALRQGGRSLTSLCPVLSYQQCSRLSVNAECKNWEEVLESVRFNPTGAGHTHRTPIVTEGDTGLPAPSPAPRLPPVSRPSSPT